MRSSITLFNFSIKLLIGTMSVLTFTPLFGDSIVLVPVYPYGSYYSNQNQIKDFDDDFFRKKPSSKFTVGASGQAHYYGEDLPYNAIQREQWIEKCSSEAEKSSKAFRKCYDSLKKKAQMDLEKSYEEVNARSSEPLRNQYPSMKRLEN